MSSQDQAESKAIEAKPAKKKSPIGWLIMLVVIIGGVAYGVHSYHVSQTREVTDNAQVDGTITQISSRVRGQVVEVMVKDNDVVKKGDVLYTLDPSDYQIRVDSAESALASAKNRLAQAKLEVALSDRTTSAQVDERLSSISVSQSQVAAAGQAVAVARAEAARTDAGIAEAHSGIARAQAGVKEALAQQSKAETEAKRLRDDRDRYKNLLAKREVSQQQYEAAAAQAKQADAQVESARQQVAAARAVVASAQAGLSNAEAARQVALESIGRAQAGQSEAQARVGEAQARVQEARAGTLQTSVTRSSLDGYQAEIDRAESALKQARLDLSYTKVTAPSAGRVTKKNISPGQYVEIGTPALALVDESDLWVVANFKETQMEHMVVGQEATLAVDTYPGTPLHGKIQSIQAGTGAVFSLLPPENASGSFVKVVQRIPVKIALTSEEQKKVPLRPGMSVEATVWLQ